MTPIRLTCLAAVLPARICARCGRPRRRAGRLCLRCARASPSGKRRDRERKRRQRQQPTTPTPNDQI